MILSAVVSTLTVPTGCGSWTSPNTPPTKGSCIAVSSSMRGRVGSSAGRSRITCDPSSLSTRCRWQCGGANHPKVRRWRIRITDPNTRHGRSAAASAARACWARWAASVTATTTASPNRSSEARFDRRGAVVRGELVGVREPGDVAGVTDQSSAGLPLRREAGSNHPWGSTRHHPGRTGRGDASPCFRRVRSRVVASCPARVAIAGRSAGAPGRCEPTYGRARGCRRRARRRGLPGPMRRRGDRP